MHHMLAEVTSHPIHLVVVVIDAQITLHEDAELRVEVEGVRFLVANELEGPENTTRGG
jgi:hypothetical protein